MCSAKMPKPTPHLEKLNATLANDKLPEADRPRVLAAIERYREWVRALEAVDGPADVALPAMVSLLDEYKRYIDLELIFDSPDDFLYRQKGQLKLDNSIIEEFLPWLLVPPVCGALSDVFRTGPTNCYSAIYFDSSLRDQRPGAGIRLRTKDQDFAISRKIFIKASHTADFSDAANIVASIGYVATEIKTNLDKTMFQEACATARDLRMAVPGARYYLMCEWLDMTPVSTAPTDIAEVLLLRKGKRLASNVRAKFSAAGQRRDARHDFEAYLRAYPFRPEVFKRWLDHIVTASTNEDPIEDDVLAEGFF